MPKKLVLVSSLAFAASLSPSALAERPAIFVPRAELPRGEAHRPAREAPPPRERLDRPARPQALQQERAARPTREGPNRDHASRPSREDAQGGDRATVDRVDPRRDHPTPPVRPSHELTQRETPCRPGSRGCGEARPDAHAGAIAASEARATALVRRVAALVAAWMTRARPTP